MKKIKIAQVITRMDWGGSPDIVRILCENLDTEMYDVRLICGPTAHPSKKTRDFSKKFKDKIFHITYLRGKINIFSDSFALFRLYCLFRKEDFDIVHTHTAKAGILGRIAARLAGAPKVIHTPHGHNFYGYFGQRISKLVVMLEKFIGYITDKIVVLTELEKDDLAVFKVAQPTNIVVINSGLELNSYREVNIDARKKRDELQVEQDTTLVGMIGRLEPVKGPEYLIEAAKLVIERFSKVKFLIVGDGSLRNKLEFRCKKLSIFDKFVFTGWREDIPEILAVLDILVLPSLNEAVGRILIEAGACGKPVVATSVGGIPEVVKDNETGILVPPKAPEALARAIIALLKSEEKRQKMGEAAKNWVDDKFSASRMVERVSNLYSELVKNGKT